MKRKQIMSILLAITIAMGCGNSVYAYPTAGVTKHIQSTIKPLDEVKIGKVKYKKVRMYTTTRVNVRKRGNIDSDIVKTLGIAEEVSVFYTKNGWSKIKGGWICSDYLSKNKPQDKLLVTENERHWLYQLVEAEAGIESNECKAWICSTVFNLMELPGTPNNVIDMIFYKNTYSPTLDGRIYKVVPKESTKEVVDSILMNGVCTNALFFETDYCHSSWHRTRQRIKQIDHTIFYR